MLLPDVNVLIYAYNTGAPFHERALSWWRATLSGAQAVGIPWVVVFGFVRLMTSPRVVRDPLTPGEAMSCVRSWFEKPELAILEPGPRHLTIVESLFAELGVAGRLTTDAQIAAIAIEHQAVLCSNDQDFGRFGGLRWINPLA